MGNRNRKGVPSHRRLAESRRQGAEDINHLDSKINQFRHDFQETMIESALSVQRVTQEVRGQGQRLDRLSHVVHNVVMDKLDEVEFRFQRSDEVMHQITMETDRRSQDMCTSIGRFIDEQLDVQKVVEELARLVDDMQNGTHPGGVSSDSDVASEQNLPDASIAMQLEIEDLKRKVARLSEQSTQHTQQISSLTPLTERVDLADSQIIR